MQITNYQDAAMDKIEQLQTRPSYEGKGRTVDRAQSGGAALVYQKNSEMLFSAKQSGKKHELAEFSNLSEADLQNQQNYMTLMSNTLSSEDYAQLSKEGFDPNEMEPRETVTILDHIKVQLAASGETVAGFNDDIAPEALQEVFGSETALTEEPTEGFTLGATEGLTEKQTETLPEGLTGELAEKLSVELAKADIAITTDTLNQVKTAWDMATSLKVPQDGTYRYLVDNELPPEIYSIYLAKSSGAQATLPGNAKYFSQDVQGYYSLSGDGIEGIEGQIDRVIHQAKLEQNEQVREEVNWLVNQGLPVTSEKLMAYHALRQLEFPVTAEHFAKAVCAALEEGKSPLQANLSQTESVYKKANQLLTRYLEVESVRFEMTAQANLQLLKSGFSFDTASLEEVVEALQKAKSELAEDYFPGITDKAQATESYTVWETTNDILSQLPTMPVATIGKFSPEEIPTLREFHTTALDLKEQYQRAGEAYEPLMTAPRGDLGDSIGKAFSNVDVLLQELGVEVTEENQRGIRILGYNQMEITLENLSAVKDAYQMVSRVVEKMTPASTLRMIRDGVNPLEQSLDQLETYLASEDLEKANSIDSYGRFLYQLENKNQITPQERESYIGIYRLIHQIEAGDHAAIGALVNMQGEITFSNLLSALRTRKTGHFDVRLDQTFGSAESVTEASNSISKQIDTAFLAQLKQELYNEVKSKEADALYDKYQYETLKEKLLTQGEALSMLERADVKETLENIQAAGELLENRFSLYKRLSQKNKETLKARNPLEKLEDAEDFQEEYHQMVEGLSQDANREAFTAEKFLDVKARQLFHKQMTILGKLSSQEEYYIPMELGGELETVHLTIQSGARESGIVDIKTTLGEETLQARLEVAGEQVRGYLVAAGEKEVMISQAASDIYSRWIKEETEFRMDAGLYIVGSLNRKNSLQDERKANLDSQAEGRPLNTQLYGLAKGFLQALKEAAERM